MRHADQMQRASAAASRAASASGGVRVRRPAWRSRATNAREIVADLRRRAAGRALARSRRDTPRAACRSALSSRTCRTVRPTQFT